MNKWMICSSCNFGSQILIKFQFSIEIDEISKEKNDQWMSMLQLQMKTFLIKIPQNTVVANLIILYMYNVILFMIILYIKCYIVIRCLKQGVPFGSHVITWYYILLVDHSRPDQTRNRTSGNVLVISFQSQLLVMCWSLILNLSFWYYVLVKNFQSQLTSDVHP